MSHEDFNFSSGFDVYENLKTSKSSDKYQYVLPYYNFDTVFDKKFLNGSLSFDSSGSNNLNNTNEIKTTVTNNLKYSLKDFGNRFGFRNEYNVFLKNKNLIGKKSNYKSSPQVELESLFEFNSKLPLIKKQPNYKNSLIPKISLKFNPTGMKNNSTESESLE